MMGNCEFYITVFHSSNHAEHVTLRECIREGIFEHLRSPIRNLMDLEPSGPTGTQKDKNGTTVDRSVEQPSLLVKDECYGGG